MYVSKTVNSIFQLEKGVYFVPVSYTHFLHNLNPLINPEGTQYGVNPLRYSVNGEEIQLPYIEKDLDMVETAMLYMDKFNRYAYSVDDNYRIQKSELTDAYTHLRLSLIHI